MELKTYQAYSMSDALAQIRKDLGEQAVILHTRSFRRGGFFGFGRKTIVEVTASGSAQVRRRQPERKGLTKEGHHSPGASPQPVVQSMNTTTASKDPASTPAPPYRAILKPQATARAASDIEVKAMSTASRPAPAKGPAVPIGPASASAASKAKSNRVSDAGPGHKAAKQAHPVARRFVIDVETGRVRRVENNVEVSGESSPGSEPQEEIPKAPAPDRENHEPSPKPPVLKKRSTTSTASDSNESSPARIIRSASATGRDRNPTTQATVAPALSPSTESRDDGTVKRELAALRQMVGQVLQKQTGSALPLMPEALLSQYVSLIENEVARDLADEICGLVRQELSEDELKDPERVREAVGRRLGDQIPVAEEDITGVGPASDGRPFTVALVGPTGVGKTTTIAKLAAAFKLREGRRVGLITTDTYRIAAVDQLRTYANIIGVPLKVALTPTEITSACHSLRECDVVLIDTAGRSPNDEARIHEIREFIEAAAPHEVHLVLSSTASESVLMRTVEQFSTVRTDRVILTKLDEAVGFGVVVNVMRKVGKALSFVTTGQEVPDHIEVGRPDRLARLILGEKVHE